MSKLGDYQDNNNNTNKQLYLDIIDLDKRITVLENELDSQLKNNFIQRGINTSHATFVSLSNKISNIFNK